MWNQIITSTLLIFVVIIVRKAFGKYISRRFVYSLWLFVAIKLLLPISMDNPFLFTNYFEVKVSQQSQIEQSEVEIKDAQKNNLTEQDLKYHKPGPITASNNPDEKAALNKQYANYGNSDTRNVQANRIFLFIWIFGIFFMEGSLLISNVIFYSKLKKDRRYRQHYNEIEVFSTACVSSPCLFGLFSPKIYIPDGWELSKQQQKYIFLHEYIHYKHKDTIWALIRCLCLSIYWFHPAVWLAGYLSKEDCETACDETVIAILDQKEKALYGRVLVEMCNLVSNVGRYRPFIQEFGGGNKEMKRRLGFICKKKKSIWSVIILAGLIMICAVGCTFGQKKGPSKKTVTTTNAVKDQNKEMENTIPVKTAEIKLSDITGADGAMLYYADEDSIIFGGCFGLFVYDTKNRKMLRNIDLKEMGCDATQGDDYCQIEVSEDGAAVYMHRNSSEEMYVYDVADNTVSKTKYDEDSMRNTALYSGKKGRSACYEQNGKEISVHLLNAWNRIGQLAYRYSNDGFARHIFVPDAYKNTKIWKKKDLRNIKKIEMFIHGEIYRCDSKKACEYLEEHMKKAEEITGASCPFYDEMYITLEDGTKGVIYPATDSCNVVMTGDGCFALSNSTTNEEFWNLLGWNPEDVRR